MRIYTAALSGLLTMVGTNATALAGQDGAFDADPYFSDLLSKQTLPTVPKPKRDEPVAVTRAEPTNASAAPRPSVRLAQAATDRPSGTPSRRRVLKSSKTFQRPLTGYLAARAGWDGVRGDAHDDGIVFGATAGADYSVFRMARGRVFAGLFGSLDLFTTERFNPVIERNDAFAVPVVVLTETPVREKRDIELGTRLGWRGGRFSFYAMMALTNRKRETRTDVSVFTERSDPAGGTVATLANSSTGTPMGLFDDGWRVGGGAEVRLYRRTFAHLGYRYSDYDTGGHKHQVLSGFGARF